MPAWAARRLRAYPSPIAARSGGSPISRPVIIVFSVLATFAALTASASAARTIKAQPGRYWAVTHLGSWHVRAHPEFGKAVLALGSPTRVQNPDSPACDATWQGLGLRIKFANFGIAESCDDGRAQSAVIKGRYARTSWRTQRGLRVGDTYRKLGRLYPNARRKPGARVIVYQDDPVLGDGSIITALLRNGGVASFRLWLGGAGD